VKQRIATRLKKNFAKEDANCSATDWNKFSLSYPKKIQEFYDSSLIFTRISRAGTDIPAGAEVFHKELHRQ